MDITTILIVAVIVAVALLLYFNRGAKSLDVNNDGKVDGADVKAAVDNVVTGVKSTADVNKDGKVDASDAKAVATKAKTAVKKAAVKAKTANRKKKPAAKA